MRHSGEQTAFPSDQTPAPRQPGRRWLLLRGMALVLTLALGIGALLMAVPSAGPVLAARSETLGTKPGGMNISQRPTFSATPGQCGGQLTVTQVNNRTITATSIEITN
jgi:hypothetical protein